MDGKAWSAISLALIAALTLASSGGRAAGKNRDALWKIVHDKCVPDQETNRDPSPCAYVDLAKGPDRGYAVLKDLVGATQFLLIPTRQISGIESPALLEPDAPNYWGAAWDARSYLLERARKPLPRDAISLAINSSVDRSQDQLHIHIDCVRADVRTLLAEHAAEIGGTWAELGFDLAGRRYRAMRIGKPDLGDSNPFSLLASDLAASGRDMAGATLVVVGASLGEGKDGFVLLEDRANPATGDSAHGEDLQDHGCTMATSLNP